MIMESDWYYWGIWISCFYWLYQSIFLIIMINSQLEKNLNKVYQRVSWFTRSIKPIQSLDEINPPLFKSIFKYLFLVLFNFCLIFLSWFYLFYLFINTMFNRYKQEGEPEVMKTFRWRMRNSDLTYDQIMEELYKIELTDKSYDEFKFNYENRIKHSREF